MNSSATIITANSARAVPPDSIYMLSHIGNRNDTDDDIKYAQEQKKIIEHNNNKLYKRTQHNQDFDVPEPGFNPVQNTHPLGINVVANHSDKGYDYRDFPQELADRREKAGY